MIRIRLREIAEARNINQAQLAVMTDLSPNTIRSYWYDQVRRPELDVLNKLCKALEINLYDLVWREGDKPIDILALAGSVA